MNLVDILILVALLTTTIVGFRRGFARSLASIAGSIGGLILGYQYSRPLADRAEQFWGITTGLANVFARYVRLVIPAAAGLPANATPVMVEQALTSQNIPAPMRDFFLRNMSETLAQIGDLGGSLTELPARTLAGMLVTAVSFTLIYIVCRCVAWLIGAALTRLAENSPLNVPNHFGGGLIGLLEGAIGVTLFVGLATMVVALLPADNAIALAFTRSGLVKLFARAFYALVPASFIPPTGPR